jgi:Domain of unknown function (DUF222)
VSAGVFSLELEAITSDPSARGLRANLPLFDRCLASIVRDLSVFDRQAGWGIDGYKSLNSWLCHETRRSNGDAHRMLQLMRQLRALPVTEEAFADGRLAASQASVIVANVTDKTIDLFADAEPELVPLLAEVSVDQTGRVMKEWAARANAAVDADNGTDPEPETDHLHFSPLMDGRFKLDGQLSGDNAKILEEGLNACLPELVEGEPVLPLWMSRTVRSATPAQWRALVARDRHCAFPGCTMKPIWCVAHHILEYDRDHGPTDIDNMALLCGGHHTTVHKPGWTAKMDPGQYLVITKPDGHVLRGPPRTLT